MYISRNLNQIRLTQRRTEYSSKGEKQFEETEKGYKTAAVT